MGTLGNTLINVKPYTRLRIIVALYAVAYGVGCTEPTNEDIRFEPRMEFVGENNQKLIMALPEQAEKEGIKICERCQRESKKSTVERVGATNYEYGYLKQYWDEWGKFHYEKKSLATWCAYRCSSAHYWRERCELGAYDWRRNNGKN